MLDPSAHEASKDTASEPATGYSPSAVRNGCAINSDGSYDLDLVIEFIPQRLFYIGLVVSGTTLLGCIVYLIYDTTN